MPKLGLLGLLVGWRKNGINMGSSIENLECEDNISLADLAEAVDNNSMKYPRTPPQPRPPISVYQRPKSMVTTSSWDEAEPSYPSVGPRPSSLCLDSSLNLSDVNQRTSDLQYKVPPAYSHKSILKDKLGGVVNGELSYGVKQKRYKKRSERNRSTPALNKIMDVRPKSKIKCCSKKSDNVIDTRNNPFFAKKSSSKRQLLKRNATIDHGHLGARTPNSFSTNELRQKVIPTYYIDNSESLPDPDHILGRLGHSLDSRLEKRHPQLSEPPKSLCVVWDLDENGEPQNSNDTDDNHFLDHGQLSDDDSIVDYNFTHDGIEYNKLPVKDTDSDCERASLKALEESHRTRLNRMGLATRSFTLLTLPEDDTEIESSFEPQRERTPSPYPRKCRGFRSLPGSPVVMSPSSPPSETIKSESLLKKIQVQKRQAISEKHKINDLKHDRALHNRSPSLSVYAASAQEQYFESRSPSPGIYKYKRKTPPPISPSRVYTPPTASPVTERGNAFFPCNSNPTSPMRHQMPFGASSPRHLSSVSHSSDNDNGEADIINDRSRNAGIPRRRRRRANRLRDSAYFSTDEAGDNMNNSRTYSNSRTGTLYRSMSAEAEISESTIQNVIEKSIYDNFNRIPEIIASEVQRQLSQQVPPKVASDITAELKDLTERVEKDFSISNNQDNKKKKINNNDMGVSANKCHDKEHFKSKIEKYSKLNNRVKLSHSCQDLLEDEPSRVHSKHSNSMSFADIDREVSHSSKVHSRHSNSISFAELGLTEDDCFEKYITRKPFSGSLDVLGLPRTISEDHDSDEDVSEVQIEGDLMELPTKHHVPLRHALRPLCRDLTKSLKKQSDDTNSTSTLDSKPKKSLVLKLKIDLDQMDGNQSDTSMEWDYYDTKK